MKTVALVAMLLLAATSCHKRDKVAVNAQEQHYRYDHYNPEEQQRMRSYPYRDPYQQERQLFSPQPRKPLQTTPSRFRKPNPSPRPNTTPHPHMPPRPVPPPPNPRPMPSPMGHSADIPNKQAAPVYVEEPGLNAEQLDPEQ